MYAIWDLTSGDFRIVSDALVLSILSKIAQKWTLSNTDDKQFQTQADVSTSWTDRQADELTLPFVSSLRSAYAKSRWVLYCAVPLL